MKNVNANKFENPTRLTDKGLKLIISAMDIDPEDEIEIPMWERIQDEKPEDMMALAALVGDYSGWSQRDSEDYARNNWKLARKVIKAAKNQITEKEFHSQMDQMREGRETGDTTVTPVK